MADTLTAMKNALVCWLFLSVSGSHAQVDSCYERAFAELTGMLEGTEVPSFKRAVFVVENAYFAEQLDYQAFNRVLKQEAALARAWGRANPRPDHHGADSVAFNLNAAAFHLMTDTTFGAPGIPVHLPFRYDTIDFFGLHDHTKMFVTKLLMTGSGNCHSMPMLYKMVCEELGTEAYLALAPNHMYIKQHSSKFGWYNTELTSASFPTDAWLMASGYIGTDAIRSGIYMDTLGLEETLALCLVDLAQGYRVRHPGEGGFPLRCCTVALRHSPQCTSALLLKADALDRSLADHHSSEEPVPEEIASILSTLVRSGYREIPLEVYLQWLGELARNPEKYANPMLAPSPTIPGQP